MNTRQKNRWWVNVALFAFFIGAFFLDWTGLTLHQWIGAAGGLIAIYHLAAHWSWVKAVTGCFFGKTSEQARIYYGIDGLLMFGLLTILYSGLIISTWLNLALWNYSTWLAVHIAASVAMLLVLLVKLALHWRWITVTAGRLFSQNSTAPAVMTPQDTNLSRRQFVKVLGGAGALLTMLALGKSIESLPAASVQSSTVDEDAASTIQNRWFTQSGSGTCQVQCNRRCSYPGHCRRYRDTNGNNRCDLGECAVS